MPTRSLGDLTRLRGHRAVVLDAPYGDGAHRPENKQQRKPGWIDRGIAESDADTERTSRQRCRNPDPEAAECGGKEHGWNIRREANVGPDFGQSPPRPRPPNDTAARPACA